MKILALSDIHGDRSLVERMAKKAVENKVDLVLLAGDIIGDNGEMEGLIGPFKKEGLEIGILPGNHEGLAEIGFLTEHYNIKNMHGYIWKKGDVGIFGCGYGDVGIHQLSEKDFFNTLKNTHDSLGEVKKKIMLTHTEPSDTILTLGMFPGSSGIRKAVEMFQPDFHLCGHVHETEGIEDVIGKTRVINVGRKGKIIEV
jgi:uncharacterized protein